MGQTAAKESAEASAAVEVLQSRIDELGDEAKKSERKVASLNREIAKLKAMSSGRGGGGGGGRGGKGGDVLGELGKSAAFFGTTIKLLKIPAIIWGIGQLVNLVGALAAGFVGLTSAIGPTLGAFAALPGLISPVLQGFGAMALGISGVSDAFKSYQQAQEAAKDPSFADAAADAQLAVNNAADAAKKYREEATRLQKEGTWAEYQAAADAATAADEALTNAREHQADVTRRQTEAQREFEEQMKKMDPSVRTFIETVESMRPKFEALRRQAQAGLFPGVVDAMKTLEPLFKSVAPLVKLTTDVFGDFARNAAKMITSPAFQKDMVPFGVENVTLLEKAGQFLLHIFDAVRNITMAAAPLTRWFADLAVNAGAWLRDWANVGRATGRFNEFFARTRETLSQIGNILRNLGGGLMGIFRGGAELGRAMLYTWERATKQFREWTRSAEGQEKIKAFFDSMRPVLYEMGRLFSALGRAMASLWMNSNMQTAELLQQIRVELLPAVVKLFGIVGGNFGPLIIDLLTSFTNLMAEVAGMTGAVQAFFQGLAAVFRIVTSILQHAGPLKDVLVSMIAFVGIWRAFKFVSIITGFANLAKAIKATATAFWTMNAATVASGNAMKATMATKFAAWLSAQVMPHLVRLSLQFMQLGVASQALATKLALVTTAGLALAAIAIPVMLIKTLNDAKRHAEEFWNAFEKDRDLTQFDDLTQAIKDADTEMSAIKEKWDRKYGGEGFSLKRGIIGAIQTFTPLKNEVADLKAAYEEGGERTEEYMMKQRLLEMTMLPTAEALGITVQQAQALADKYGIDLGPVLNNWNADAKSLAPEIVKVRDAMHEIVAESVELTPAAKDIIDSLRGIAGGADDAHDRVNALRNVLSNMINPGLDAEKAQIRLDEALGKTTKKVDEQTGSVNDLTAAWKERQDQAKKDAEKAKGEVAAAQAEVDRLKTEGTWEQYMRAKEKLDEAKAAEAAAQSRLSEPKPLAPKAVKQARNGVEVAHEAISAYQEWAMAQYALRGANKQAGEEIIAELQTMRGEFRETLKQAGLNQTEIDKYLGYFDNIPASVATTVLMDIPDDKEKADFFVKYQGELNKFFTANPALKPKILAELELDETQIRDAINRAMAAAGVQGVPANPPSGWQGPPYKLPTPTQPTGTSTGVMFDPTTGQFTFNFAPRATGGIERMPQISDKPILWAEGRAPEAYIPYDPRYRRRALGLLSTVARDFGVSILPRMEKGGVRKFEAGALVPHQAIRSIDSSIRQMAAGGVIGSGSSTTSSAITHHHNYQAYIDTVDRRTGEQLGRDIAWGFKQARGAGVR